jgi:hypothetical protein
VANLLSWIGNQASRIEKQVNPFANGATYSNPNPRPAPPPQYNTGGLTVNNAPNTQQISVRPSPAPVRPPRPILFNNAPNTQQINVPKFTGPGMYSWNKPTPYQLPQLGTPGHGINLGHWFGSSLFENALNAPEQINNVVQAKRAGVINTEQALGGLSNALLNSAGLAIPAGKVEQIAKMSAPAIKDVITQGVKTGAKLGAGFGAAGGALNSMQQGGNAGQVIKSAAINAPIGAVTGAALGGAVPVVAKGVHLTAKTAPKVAKAVKPQIPPELLQERNKWVGTYSNAKDPAIKNFADRKITQIDNQIALAREAGFVKIPGRGTPPTQGVKANVPEVANASSSAKVPSAERYPSPSPKVAPELARAGTTPKTAPPKQSGLKTELQALGQPQDQSLKPLSENSPKQNPSTNTTPTLGFIQSVKQSAEVSPTVAKRASGTYQVRNTAKLAEQADKFASTPKAVERVSSALNAKDGNITDRTVANAIAVAKKLDSNMNHAQATDIYERLADHLKAQGQSVQAASLLDRRTPEGIRYQITKTFKKAGVTPSQDVINKIDAKMSEIKTTKAGTPERVLATKQLQKIVADNLPSNVSDKAISFWKAGLLTGARTQSGNLLSNETFSVLHNASNPLAAGLDKLISLKTGQRTKTLTGRGLISGTGEGIKRGGTYLKTGIDERSTLTNKFDSRQVNFKNKALNTYVNGVFKLMGAADRPHYYRQLRSSLNDLASADGKNRGLTGQALRDHVNNFVKDPPQQAFQTATNEAEKAVLANDTILSKAIANLRSTAENAESPLGKAVTEAAINLIMPFTKVPSAFISRVVDFTPAGALKTIFSQVSRKQFDQRALVTALSEATTGYGLMALGYRLAQNNMLSGDYPSDPKEQQRWKAEGIQPNSIKVGGQWINMNYAGPLGLLFGAGGRMAEGKAQGGSWMSQQAQAYGGLPKSLTQQSFLQGLSGAMQAINEPGRYLNNYEKSQAGSIVPTLIGDVATATDNQQRATNGPGDAIKARIPGLRESLNPAQDVYGNTLPRKTGAASTMINPLRPSADMSNKNPVIKEVNRLHNVDPNNSDLQVTPTPVNKTIKVEGNPVHLSNQQRYDLQNLVGQTTQSNWSKLIQTPEYKAMSDLEKAKALSNLRTDSTTLAEREYFTKTALATYQKPATASVQRLANGDLSKYLGLSTSKSTKSSIKTARVSRAKSSSRRSSGSSASNSAALAKFKADMKQKPLKTVGALPAPSKTIPKFTVPTLKTVYQKPSVNTKPTVGFKKSKRA